MVIGVLFEGVSSPQSVPSSKCLPINCSPTGIPSTKPQGMDIPGIPARLTERYRYRTCILEGPPFSPQRKAGVGETSETSRSYAQRPGQSPLNQGPTQVSSSKHVIAAEERSPQHDLPYPAPKPDACLHEHVHITGLTGGSRSALRHNRPGLNWPRREQSGSRWKGVFRMGQGGVFTKAPRDSRRAMAFSTTSDTGLIPRIYSAPRSSSLMSLTKKRVKSGTSNLAEVESGSCPQIIFSSKAQSVTSWKRVQSGPVMRQRH